ncbi:MAG: patatin-like phospholipase family protein [Cyclobacteriaceae bacterium]|nr:patatin-like phospholipase family protein [Cyclobacteriaceae bacterium]
MFRIIKIIFYLLFLSVFSPGLGQSAKPKIGLVLSGGGAKGIAHIRVLQVLDSLGIVPDYIAGTSMGSVVGALYAAGYTGNQIDSIAKAINWTAMFSNSVEFRDINIEEKDEFGRYIYELSLDGLKPRLPLGFVAGQQIEELLSNLFFPVSTITDFNKLPTPFLCVAADIIKGEPVVLRSGSLATAVRASMSIPTVFEPVRIGNRLFVDGGVFVNFPVTYCREMGADYVIAVDVGGGLYEEKELTSALTMLLQTTFLAGNIDYQKERDQCDIYVNVLPFLTYSTMDFEHTDAMLAAGDSAVAVAMPELVALVQRMKDFPGRKVQRINFSTPTYTLEHIGFEGVSQQNEKFVKARFDLKPGKTITRSDAGEAVYRIQGTRLFDKVNYVIESDSSQSQMVIRGREKSANAVKFAIHYDSERGAGLLLNFTKRNVLLPASRFLTTVDLAENPGLRVNYFYYFGKHMRWWHFTEFYAENVLLNTYINGTAISDLINRNSYFNMVLNQTLSRNAYWGFGPAWQWSQLKPKIDPRDQSNPDPFEVINYNLSSLGAKVHFNYNTLDKVFFPTQGKWIRAEAKVNFNAPYNLNFLTNGDEVPLEGNVQTYGRLTVKGLRNITLRSRMTLQLITQLAFTQDLSSRSESYSSYLLGAGDFMIVGGSINRPRLNNFVFMGLREGELTAPQVITVGTQLQTELYKNVYLSPAVNLIAAGFDSSDYWRTLFDFNFSEDDITQAFYQFGYGVTASYMSLIGPVQVTVSNNSEVRKLRWHFSIGFTL